MIPIHDSGGVYINGIMVLHLLRSDGRPGSRGDGFAMWSYNCRPIGWIDDGSGLIECVTAALLLDDKLAPQWEDVPDGMRFIHPRYTLAIDQTSNGWVPSITDELTRRCHRFTARQTRIEAVHLVDNLLRRHLGRERPTFDLHWWLSAGGLTHTFQLALSVAGVNIASLVRDEPIAWRDYQLASAVELAGLLDKCSFHGINPLPRLATILATYFKSALIDLYRGADTIVVDPAGSTLRFSYSELAAFRAHFRRSPMTDGDYLDFVKKHFVAPLQSLRRKQHSPKASFRRLKPLRPRRDRGDFVIAWPYPPGSRLNQKFGTLDTYPP
jgi:hypothetical protein